MLHARVDLSTGISGVGVARIFKADLYDFRMIFNMISNFLAKSSIFSQERGRAVIITLSH